MEGQSVDRRRRQRLIRLIALSIAAAIATITLKVFAWLVTDSVGLLSDAAESVVNLVAALIALSVILWSTRPPDEEHAYGHEKADYLSAGFEGALILAAAVTIAWAAIDRLLNPAGLTDVGFGLGMSVVASLINLGVARMLIKAGDEEDSLTLVADGHHLMADVWTSAGVVAGVALAWLTGWGPLDSIVALLVAAQIVRTGQSLVRESMGGLMDRALPGEERQAIEAVLAARATGAVQFHALRTRKAGRRSFISVHVLVPGDWTVQKGHDFVESVESELRAAVYNATVFTHLEPVEDPASFADTGLDRV
ncbi:MAG: cation diffusion facilitator family transporter [Solirubrobacterales bacterium]|jgi:cation diffusion facilitator family transporter